MSSKGEKQGLWDIKRTAPEDKRSGEKIADTWERSVPNPSVWHPLRSALTPQVLLLCTLASLSLSGAGLVAPVLPELQNHFGVSRAQVALVMSSFGAARLAMDLPVGYLSNRRHMRRTLLLIGLLSQAVGSAYAAFAWSFPHLMVARVLMGVGSAVIVTLALGWLIEIASSTNRATVVTLYQSATTAGLSITPMLGGYATQVFTWRSVFVASLVMSLLSILLLKALPQDRAQKQAGTTTGGHQTTGVPRGASQLPGWKKPLALLAVYGAVFAFSFEKQGFTNTFLPLYGYEKLGLDPVAIGLAIGIASLINVCVSVPGGLISDRLSRSFVLLPGLLFLALGELSFLVLTDSGGFFLGAVLMGFAGLGMGAPATLIGDLIKGDGDGPGMGLYRLTIDTSLLISPIVMGLALDIYGYQTPIFLAAGLTSIALVAALLIVLPAERLIKRLPSTDGSPS